MDDLKKILNINPCYEQHIVSIKNFYEEHLFSILVPAIYEGICSMYKKSYIIEQKFIEATKNNPEVKSKTVLEIFQTVIKDVPNLNTHKIRNETDRIKSSSRCADIFDDLIKAVIKANIILLTYNVDHKQKNLLQTRFHENVIIHDFIHNCYISSCRNFYNCSELFYHKYDNVIINQNKRNCFNIIKISIKEAIRKSLPLKEILLEYITQKYEQKDIYMNPYNKKDMSNYGVNIKDIIEGDNDVNNDISRFSNHHLLDNNENIFRPESSNNINDENYSLLIDENTSDDFSITRNTDNNTGSCIISDINDDNKIINLDSNKKLSNNSASDNGLRNTDISESMNKIINNETDKKISNNSASDDRLRMIDISGTMNKKGNAQTYFKEIIPDIQKRVEEYKIDRKNKQNSIEINRINSENNIVSELLR